MEVPNVICDAARRELSLDTRILVACIDHCYDGKLAITHFIHSKSRRMAYTHVVRTKIIPAPTESGAI